MAKSRVPLPAAAAAALADAATPLAGRILDDATAAIANDDPMALIATDGTTAVVTSDDTTAVITSGAITATLIGWVTLHPARAREAS